MKHVFVVTYGRSGSTVLLSLLNAIDGYCIRGENLGAIRHLCAAANTTRQATAQFVSRKRDADHPWYGVDRADADGFERALADAFVRFVLVPPDNARATGFKEIRYTPSELSDEQFDQIIAFMLTAFGDARIVFNTRDWREVAKSGWWAERPKNAVREEIVASDKRFARAHARYPGQTFMIDHAQYNGNPNGFVVLLAWLGESLEEERLLEISERRLTHLKNQDRPGAIRRLWTRLADAIGRRA